MLSFIAGISLCNRLASISIRNLNISNSQTSSPPSNYFSLQTDEILKHNNLILQSTNSSLIKEIGNHNPVWRKEIFELPLTNKIIENPASNNKIIEDIINIEKSIIDPNSNKNGDAGKQAARLIVIRRSKMKKHKRRKLAKKMKFIWAKALQRKEWKKEKNFLNGLLNKINEARKFSAEEYVRDTIKQATEEVIPRMWKGRKMPKWLIIEQMEKVKKQKTEQKYIFWEECAQNAKKGEQN